MRKRKSLRNEQRVAKARKALRKFKVLEIIPGETLAGAVRIGKDKQIQVFELLGGPFLGNYRDLELHEWLCTPQGRLWEASQKELDAQLKYARKLM
jgi:hypothetical protein